MNDLVSPTPLGHQLFLVFCPEERSDEMEQLLVRLGLSGFSEVRGVQGSGITGRRFGTRAFPGGVSLFTVIVEEQRQLELATQLTEMARECRPGQGMRVVALPVRSIL